MANCGRTEHFVQFLFVAYSLFKFPDNLRFIPCTIQYPVVWEVFRLSPLPDNLPGHPDTSPRPVSGRTTSPRSIRVPLVHCSNPPGSARSVVEAFDLLQCFGHVVTGAVAVDIDRVRADVAGYELR